MMIHVNQKDALAVYLHQDKQTKIINQVLDKHKIKNRFDRDAFDRTINLGCSPNSSEESWKKVKEGE